MARARMCGCSSFKSFSKAGLALDPCSFTAEKAAPRTFTAVLLKAATAPSGVLRSTFGTVGLKPFGAIR